MTHPTPWIAFHAVWTSRTRRGRVLYDLLAQFVQAFAVDPTPEESHLRIHEELGPELARRTRGQPADPAKEAEALAAIGYRPGPLVEEATARFGPGRHRRWASGASGYLFHWEWEWPGAAIDRDALLAFQEAHERLPKVGGLAAVGVRLRWWFELAHPGTRAPVYPGSTLRSSVTADLGSRHVSMMIRHDRPDDTPDFRALHAAILAALGPRPPRHVVDLILPPRAPGGRERRQRLP
ncbi:MAG TPA: hypothetical protein VHE35_07025 [Kofleriaceae bacterium]|nr:hypothetical protein [Kofleriaceae bacterium]